jgi:NAD+ kinase
LDSRPGSPSESASRFLDRRPGAGGGADDVARQFAVRDGYEIVTSLPARSTVLHWERKPRNVLVIAKPGDAAVRAALTEIGQFLTREHDIAVFVEDVVHSEVEHVHPYFRPLAEAGKNLEHVIDLVVCVGGDGTLLHANKLFARSSCPPVLPFAMGSLGFLAPFSIHKFREELNEVLEGNSCFVTLRGRLHCTQLRAKNVHELNPEHAEAAGKTPALGSSIPDFPRHQRVRGIDTLNEAVVGRGLRSYLTKLLLYANGRFVTTVQADGLIIASATGSAAYSLSAGGSLVSPSVGCIMLTPVCAHTLSFRPMILPPSTRIRVQVPVTSESEATVALDGTSQASLAPGDALEICMSRNTFPTITKGDQTTDWLESVVRNLHWNTRVQQKDKRSNIH